MEKQEVQKKREINPKLKLKEHKLASLQKKAALINDLSGFGRCSLSVELPVLSLMQIECLLLPTCLLSNHTGYPSYYMQTLEASMDPIMDEWKILEVKLDAIITGYLASVSQVEHVLRFLSLFPSSLTVIDPVLGDDGKAYPGISKELEKAMKKLVSHASVLLPNLTEACLLTNTPWKKDFSHKEIEAMAFALQKQGAKQVVISGISQGEFIEECVLGQSQTITWLKAKKEVESRAGTGDLFCAVVSGYLLHGYPLNQCVKLAGDFVRAALIETEKLHVPPEEGVAFEMVLCRLCNCANRNASNCSCSFS